MLKATLCLIGLCGLVLVAGGPAHGQDADVLQQFDGAMRGLADRADAAVVSIRAPGASPWVHVPDSGEEKKASEIHRRYQALAQAYQIMALARGAPAGSMAAGVLVGSPPVLVTAADAVGTAKVVTFELTDGTTGTAKLKGLDRDLGVAVFTLPDEVAAGRVGLTVSSTPRVRRGRPFLVPGLGKLDVMRPLSLGLCRGNAPLCGWFVVDGMPDDLLPGQPAVAMDGRLAGIAARSVGTTSGHSNLPIVFDTTFNQESQVLTVTPRVETTADGRFKVSGTRATPYTYVVPTNRPGDLLPTGAFIQGSAIARVIEDLERYGEVHHSYLGVVLGQMRGKGEDRGVEIQAVLEGSPAEAAGLTAGARIRTVAGLLVEEPVLVTRALVLHRPGDTLLIQLVGAEEPLTVVLGDRTRAAESLLTPDELGLNCMDLGPELASYLQLDEGTRGVVVRSVRPQSPAANAGLTRGQIIVAGGGEPIADLEELRAAVAGAKERLSLEVISGRERRTLDILIPKGQVPTKAR